MSDSTRWQGSPGWGAGLAIGLGVGVAMSVALDNWAFMSIGIVFAVALGAFGSRRGGGSDGDGSAPPDDPDVPDAEDRVDHGGGADEDEPGLDERAELGRDANPDDRGEPDAPEDADSRD